MGSENNSVKKKQNSTISLASHLSRIAIALVLVTSGLVHLQNVPGHLVAIANYRIVSVALSQFIGFVLPSIHVAVGVSLLLNEFRWLCLLTAIGVFGAYTLAQLSVLLRGLQVDCGCLGPSISSTVGVDTVLRTVLLLGICIWLLWIDEERPTLSSRYKFGRAIDRSAMTLIELLVCISMIGVIVALLLPAIQSARETGRRMSCMNNQRQLVLAAQNHESTHRKFPSTGWGYNWIGMHDQGPGERQPGSWIFAVLPNMEQNNLWLASPTAERPHTPIEFQSHVLQKVPQLVCPSKELDDPQTANGAVVYRYGSNVAWVSRTDYAVNSGDKILKNNAGPSAINDINFVWPNLDRPSGIAYVRSKIRNSEVADGTTNVIFCGEKWAERSGQLDRGYDQPWSTGDSQESRRFTEKILLRDGSVDGDFERFGSNHSTGGVFAFVDGSVHIVHFSIHPSVYRSLGNRFDGNNGVIGLP